MKNTWVTEGPATIRFSSSWVPADELTTLDSAMRRARINTVNLARAAGVSYTTISNFRHGYRPRLEIAIAMARVLKLSGREFAQVFYPEMPRAWMAA